MILLFQKIKFWILYFCNTQNFYKLILYLIIISLSATLLSLLVQLNSFVNTPNGVMTCSNFYKIFSRAPVSVLIHENTHLHRSDLEKADFFNYRFENPLLKMTILQI